MFDRFVGSGMNEMEGLHLVNQLEEDWSQKILTKFTLLDVEVTPEAVLKIRELCEIAEFNLKHHNPESISKVEADGAVDALVVTVLEDAVPSRGVKAKKLTSVVDVGAIVKALENLSPIFPFTIQAP